MSNSIRFLGAAILAWAAVRAVSLGLIPGTQALAFDAQAVQLAKPAPAIQPSPLPPFEPAAPAYSPPPPAAGNGPQMAYAGYPGYVPYPIYVPIPSGSAARSMPPQIIYVDRSAAIPAEINVYGGAPQTVESRLPGAIAAVPVPERQSTPSFDEMKVPKLPDRLSISSWATMRNRAGSDGLANGGLLGGSQAGARLLWQVNALVAASLRASAPINSQRGVEAAAGVRYQPFSNWPVAFTLERRQSFRDYGQSAFALFAEGGLYNRPMPWNSTLDGYFQGGVVDFNDPVWFVDGQIAVTRPVWRNLSAGLGMWGGAQPGLNRLDIGPRASLKVGSRIRVHLDYRHKLLGNAVPGSGGVVTLGGDF
jgi:hypothetical protein